MEESPVQFLDVPTLLESSQPQPRGNWMWFGVGIFFVVVVFSTWAGSHMPELQPLIKVFSALMFMGVIVMLSVFTLMTVKSQRERMEQLESVEEMIQLRRWPDAAG